MSVCASVALLAEAVIHTEECHFFPAPSPVSSFQVFTIFPVNSVGWDTKKETRKGGPMNNTVGLLYLLQPTVLSRSAIAV